MQNIDFYSTLKSRKRASLSMLSLEIVKAIYYRSHVSGGVLTFFAFKVL